jgi:hypothetical protein
MLDVADVFRESRNEHAALIRRRDQLIQALKVANAETLRCKDVLAAARVRPFLSLELVIVLTSKRELVKVSTGIKNAEEKERKLADELSNIEQVDVGADLVELRNVRTVLRDPAGPWLTDQNAEARKRGEEEQLAQLQSELEGHRKVEQEAKNSLKEIEAELETLAPQRTETIVSHWI